MNFRTLSIRHARFTVLTLASLLIGQSAGLGASYQLQGRSAGSATWVAGNLQDWKELDYIPCRVLITGGRPAARTSHSTFRI